MGIFVRTFIITLLFCVGYYFYVSLNGASYERNIDVPEKKDEMVWFWDKKDKKVEEPQRKIEVPDKDEEAGKAPAKKAEAKVATIKVCFVTPSNDYKFVNRTAKNEGIETAIQLLLEGPSDKEKADGLYSEIPPKTKLYWVKQKNGDLIVNLSENFAQGGGSTSVTARIAQLVKTVKIYSPDAPVYLYIDGKKAEYIGGDGVFLKQPLN